MNGNSNKGYWAVAGSGILTHAITNERLARLYTYAIEPPSTERYAWWCERSALIRASYSIPHRPFSDWRLDNVGLFDRMDSMIDCHYIEMIQQNWNMDERGMWMEYRYDYLQRAIWYNDAWSEANGAADPLLQWIGGHMESFPLSSYNGRNSDPTSHPFYKQKTNAVDLPEVSRYWAERGIRYTSLEQGCKHWISMLPEQAIAQGAKLKVLVVLHKEDCAQAWWAMDTLAKRHNYNEIAAKRQDTLVLYLVADGPDSDRIFGNILQEAFCLYPVNLEEVYLDVSPVFEMGSKLSAIDGFLWTAKDGTVVDPDSMVEEFEGIPVLNISGRWGSKDSLARSLIMNHAMNRGLFDTERLICSVTGEKLAKAFQLEKDYQTIYDERYRDYWNQVGLQFDINESFGRRWLMYAPREQIESREKLPLVLAMQEVYRGNEHLAVTAAAYFHEYLMLAAQGECMVLFFALEDPDSNDLLEAIAEQAMQRYPVDASRVYVTGHSHDGWFARRFAYRHPRMIAALATMGNCVGLPNPKHIGNDIMGVSDEELEQMSVIDMPTININGAAERFSRYPDTLQERLRWAEDWQRRLKASRCPNVATAQLLKVQESPHKAERAVGICGDRAFDFWLDGFEHYIVDVRNCDGNYHLRIAASENMPHTVTPCMIDISWSYLRSFARDLQTGQVIERNEGVWV